jgi:hypothetical protein
VRLLLELQTARGPGRALVDLSRLSSMDSWVAVILLWFGRATAAGLAAPHVLPEEHARVGVVPVGTGLGLGGLGCWRLRSPIRPAPRWPAAIPSARASRVGAGMNIGAVRAEEGMPEVA